eukprot:TRINITY_DN28282_c1_g4_i2.p1 TRINITY_DN28282_c1_g4~~TRINITY_DN28282_c1_g4_i2.p1  ORF type:complete len:335 (-),score=76.43 TRINITY_DN28282_c1_g4_i2:91-1095(-)
MHLSDVLGGCNEVAEHIAMACDAAAALSLSNTSTCWENALSGTHIWKGYLTTPCAVVRHILAAESASFTRPCSVHPSNFKAIVAAFVSPAWARRFPRMKQLIASGHLKEPLSFQRPKGTARRAKKAALAEVAMEKRLRQARLDRQAARGSFQHKRQFLATAGVYKAKAERVVAAQLKKPRTAALVDRGALRTGAWPEDCRMLADVLQPAVVPRTAGQPMATTKPGKQHRAARVRASSSQSSSSSSRSSSTSSSSSSDSSDSSRSISEEPLPRTPQRAARTTAAPLQAQVDSPSKLAPPDKKRNTTPAGAEKPAAEKTVWSKPGGSDKSKTFESI